MLKGQRSAFPFILRTVHPRLMEAERNELFQWMLAWRGRHPRYRIDLIAAVCSFVGAFLFEVLSLHGGRRMLTYAHEQRHRRGFVTRLTDGVSAYGDINPLLMSQLQTTPVSGAEFLRAWVLERICEGVRYSRVIFFLVLLPNMVAGVVLTFIDGVYLLPMCLLAVGGLVMMAFFLSLLPGIAVSEAINLTKHFQVTVGGSLSARGQLKEGMPISLVVILFLGSYLGFSVYTYYHVLNHYNSGLKDDPLSGFALTFASVMITVLALIPLSIAFRERGSSVLHRLKYYEATANRFFADYLTVMLEDDLEDTAVWNKRFANPDYYRDEGVGGNLEWKG